MKRLGEIKRHGEILAIRTDSGSIVGFHAGNLEVANLDAQMWPLLDNAAFDGNSNDVLTEMKAELEEWNASQSPSAKSGQTPAGIRSLTINVAQVCNLACTYCAAGGDGTYGSRIKKPELDRVREQLSMLLAKVPAHSGESFVLTFLGGEPLLVPELIEAIARDAKLLIAGRGIRLRFDIVTNGTLVTPEIAEMLACLGAHVTVSIDGAPEDHDRARVTKSGAGSSAAVLKGLEELIKVRDRLDSLTAGAVLGKHNLKVVEAYQFLSRLPFDTIKFDFAADVDDAEASREFARQMLEVADLAWSRGGEKELRRLAVFNHLFHTLNDQIRIENHCLAGKSHLQLDTEGRFTACQWFIGEKDEEVGRDLEISESKLQAFEEPLISKHGCGSCWARHLCGGGCMFVNKLKTGNKHKVDAAFCERTRTILAKGIERYAESRYNSQPSGARSEIH